MERETMPERNVWIVRSRREHRGQRSKRHGERSTDLHELRLSGTITALQAL